MTDSTSRLFALVGVLVGVWVITYWLYEPSGRPKITRDPLPPALVATGLSASPTAGDGLVQTPPIPVSMGSPTGNQQTIAITPEPTFPVAIAPPPPVLTETRMRVVAPQFREVVVQKGDSSWQRIARRELGDASLWQAVARANPLLTSDRLYPGKTRVKIPLDPDNTQGKVVEVVVPVGTSSATEQAGVSGGPATPTAAAPIGQSYTISADDTLWSIAKKFYGKGGSWRTIYDANRTVIVDPDKPPIGATITIPAAGAAGT